MKTRLGFLNSLRASVCFAPPDELTGIGSFGGGNDDNSGGNGFENPGQQSSLIGVGGAEEEENPLNEILTAFADEDPGDDDDPANPPAPPAIPQEQVTAMQTAVQNAIGQMRITDDMIPQDFDPNDRGQLTQVMNRIMQHTIAQSMNVVFQPVQLAMKQMAMTLQNQIDTKITESQTGMRDSTVLESIVPEINDPQYAGLVKNMDATLKAKGKKAKDRATTIRKMLNQMGVQSSGNNRRTANPGGGESNATIKTGHAALDSFFGSFTPPQQQRNR